MFSKHKIAPGFEIILTPGEKVQNWLAARGYGQKVSERDIEHPEPPAGLWVAFNALIAIVSITTALALVAGIVVIALWLTTGSPAS